VSTSYDRLKTVKFWRFVRSGPFPQIRSHIGTALLVIAFVSWLSHCVVSFLPLTVLTVNPVVSFVK